MLTTAATAILEQAATPEQAAAHVLDTYWDMKLPVNPVAIARSMGVRVLYDDELRISGHFTYNEDGEPVILINPDESRERKRFTAFHELGHYVLGHGPRPRDPFQAYNQHRFDPKEAAANKFAAAMIMPRKAIAFYLTEKGYGLREMAALFAVSLTAMRIRLENLGYIHAA